MVLPLSGPLGMGDLVAEFGGTGSAGLSEYYRGGSLVPDTPANASIPMSGTVSISDFYGGDATSVLPYGINVDMGRSPGIVPQDIGYSDNTIGGVWNFPGLLSSNLIGPTPRTIKKMGWFDESTGQFYLYLAGILPLGEVVQVDVTSSSGIYSFFAPTGNFYSGGNTVYYWSHPGGPFPARWTTLEANTGVVYAVWFYM